MSRYDMSPEAAQILEFLKPAPARFTYNEIRALTGVNDLSRLRGYLMTALRRMRKDGVWYISERGIGYRKLAEDGKNTSQSIGLDRVKRRINRIDRDQDLISFDRLTHDGKLTFTINTARIGLLKQAGSLKQTRKIIRAAANSDLPVRKPKR